jgi:uncharacterized protein
MHTNFTYDDAKNRINIRKHGISFADVEGVFYDLNAVTIEDKDHGEQRFVTLGMDSLLRILVVCFTQSDDEIRIISARKADPSERKSYED